MNPNTNILRALPKDTILKGQYLVEACVGSGGFGITYRAKNLKAKDDAVAIKEYFPRAVVERGDRGRVQIRPDAIHEFRRWQENYEREYSLLAKLRGNRAILNVRETFQENGTSYLVMDFIPGTTLETHVRDGGPLNGQAALALLRPFLPELAKMHHAGILHRDINPGNIMLPPGDMPKLIDFGSARPVPKDIGGRLTALLRPGFAPPEQYDSKARQGPQADVYGLCASLYFALTGVVPPDGRLRLVKDELIPLSQLCVGPESLIRAVTHGLNPVQEKRPVSFEALWQEIFGDMAAAVPEAAKTERVEPLPKAIGLQASLWTQARAEAARKAARLLRPLNPRRWDAFLAGLEPFPGSKDAAQSRIGLEDGILNQGLLFSLLCALLTRKSA